MTDERYIGKDSEGTSHCLIEVYCRICLEGPIKTTKPQYGRRCGRDSNRPPLEYEPRAFSLSTFGGETC
jgi:hypothetical protein